VKKTGGELTKQNFVFVLRLIGYPPHEAEIRASDQELDKKVETLEKRQDSLEVIIVF
jgi:Ca2+-binding EF-hand superfamily protein